MIYFDNAATAPVVRSKSLRSSCVDSNSIVMTYFIFPVVPPFWRYALIMGRNSNGNM